MKDFQYDGFDIKLLPFDRHNQQARPITIHPAGGNNDSILLYTVVITSGRMCCGSLLMHNYRHSFTDSGLCTVIRWLLRPTYVVFVLVHCACTAVFTVRRYALHGLSYRNSVCPSVRPSVRLSHSCTVSTWFNMVQPTIMVSPPYGSPIILVSGDIKFIPKFEGDHPERRR